MDSEFSDFLSQLPPILPIMFCGFVLMFVAALSMLVRNQSRKSTVRMPDRRARAAALSASAMPDSSGDLPDLDQLLGASSAPPPMPAAKPSASPPVSPPAAYSPPPPAPPVRRAATSMLRLVDGSSVEAAEVMVVSRDLSEGTLVIQIGDKAYGSAAQISDAEARRRFAGIMRELVKLGNDMSKLPVTETPVSTAPTPEPEHQAYTPPPASPPLPRKLATGEIPGDLPRFNSDDIPVKRQKGAAPSAPIPEINIASAIEAFLQYKLENTPEYAGRTIHVHPALHGGVSIEVDGRSYEAVSDIEDTATRTFLADTIQEWQSRQ